MKQVWALVFLAACVSVAQAAEVGTTAANFLQLGVGPRAVAMGDAQVGLADDVYASYWNPAGLAQLHVQEAGFVQNQYIEDISQQYAAYAVPHPTLGTFAGSLTYLGVGKFQGYDASGQTTSSIGASDAAFGLSYARSFFSDRRMGSGLALGATAKYIYEHLDTVSRPSYAGDFGLLYTPGKRWGDALDGWQAGMVLRHIGTPLRYDQESFDLPRSLDAGLSYTGTWRDETLTATLDGRQPGAGSGSWGAGLELRTLQYLMVRTGYTSAGDLGNGFRVGAGLRFKTIQVDYAYAGEGGFGGAHRVGLTLRFGKMQEDPLYVAQRWYDRGLKDYRRRRYTEALVEFNKALEIDPSHPDALKMMKKTYEDIKTIVPE